MTLESIETGQTLAFSIWYATKSGRSDFEWGERENEELIGKHTGRNRREGNKGLG